MSLAQTPYVFSSYVPPQSGPGILLGAGVGILNVGAAKSGSSTARQRPLLFTLWANTGLLEPRRAE